MKSTKTPFFSFLVPTRDRPELIRFALESLKRQTFTDFEVVVSDNYTTRPCKDVFDGIADERFRYVTPTSPLSMPDNWEFASRHASGEYVGVLIDKTVLLPTALQTVADTARNNPAEIISWWNEGYYLKDETIGYGLGTYAPTCIPCQAEYFDPIVELRRRFSFDVRRGREGKHYYWGKICFGVYHRDLIKRIKERIGRLFLPLSPDYTSMLAALALAKSALDLGRPLLISFASQLSTGASAAQNPAFAKNFYKQIGYGVIDKFPLPGLYTSHHNSVAYDYLQIQRKIGEGLSSLQLNLENLILRAEEDLEQQQWNEKPERLEQEAILAPHLKTVRATTLARYRLTRLARDFSRIRQSLTARWLLRPLAHRNPNFRKFVKALLREPYRSVWEHPRNFSSIIEAAEAANSYYNSPLAEKVVSKT